MKRLGSLIVLGLLMAAVVGCGLCPPNTPDAPRGPSRGNTQTRYPFSAVTTDPNEDPVAYRFDWGGGNLSDWSEFVASGEPVQMVNLWPRPGVYTVRAQARDIVGLMSCWSPGHGITIGRQQGPPDSVIATIPTRGDPMYLCVNPQGNHVYLGQEVGSSVIVIDAVNHTVARSVPVGSGPCYIDCSPSGDMMYVSHHGSGEVRVVRTRDYQTVATINVPNGYDNTSSLACLPNGEYVYVAVDDPEDKVVVIRTSDNTITATIPLTGSSPRQLCCSPDGQYVYTANYYSNNITKIRTSDNTVVATWPCSGAPHRLCIAPDGSRLYVSCRYDGVRVLSTRDGSQVAFVSAGPSVGIAATPDGKCVLVNSHSLDRTTVIRTSDNSIIKTISVGTWPMGICISPDGSKAWVANRHSQSVSVLGRSTGDGGDYPFTPEEFAGN